MLPLEPNELGTTVQKYGVPLQDSLAALYEFNQALQLESLCFQFGPILSLVFTLLLHCKFLPPAPLSLEAEVVGLVQDFWSLPDLIETSNTLIDLSCRILTGSYN